MEAGLGPPQAATTARLERADLFLRREALYPLSYAVVTRCGPTGKAVGGVENLVWAPTGGLEPPTMALTAPRSTIELHGNTKGVLSDDLNQTAFDAIVKPGAHSEVRRELFGYVDRAATDGHLQVGKAVVVAVGKQREKLFVCHLCTLARAKGLEPPYAQLRRLPFIR